MKKIFLILCLIGSYGVGLQAAYTMHQYRKLINLYDYAMMLEFSNVTEAGVILDAGLQAQNQADRKAILTEIIDSDLSDASDGVIRFLAFKFLFPLPVDVVGVDPDDMAAIGALLINKLMDMVSALG